MLTPELRSSLTKSIRFQAVKLTPEERQSLEDKVEFDGYQDYLTNPPTPADDTSRCSKIFALCLTSFVVLGSAVILNKLFSYAN